MHKNTIKCPFLHHFILIFRNTKTYLFSCFETKWNPDLPKSDYIIQLLTAVNIVWIFANHSLNGVHRFELSGKVKIDRQKFEFFKFWKWALVQSFSASQSKVKKRTYGLTDGVLTAVLVMVFRKTAPSFGAITEAQNYSLFSLSGVCAAGSGLIQGP